MAYALISQFRCMIMLLVGVIGRYTADFNDIFVTAVLIVGTGACCRGKPVQFKTLRIVAMEMGKCCNLTYSPLGSK